MPLLYIFTTKGAVPIFLSVFQVLLSSSGLDSRANAPFSGLFSGSILQTISVPLVPLSPILVKYNLESWVYSFPSYVTIAVTWLFKAK